MKGGFTNCQKAGGKFKEHEKSHFHLEAVNKMAALNSMPINALLSDVMRKKKKTLPREF